MRKLGLFDGEFWAAKNSYKEAKKNAKRVVWVQKQIASRTQFADVDLKGPEIHRMASRCDVTTKTSAVKCRYGTMRASSVLMRKRE